MTELANEPGCYLDMNKSGSRLVWEFFFPEDEVPLVRKLGFDSLSSSPAYPVC